MIECIKKFSGGHDQEKTLMHVSCYCFCCCYFYDCWYDGCRVMVKKVLGLEAEYLSSSPNYATYSAYDLGQGTIRKCIS